MDTQSQMSGRWQAIIDKGRARTQKNVAPLMEPDETVNYFVANWTMPIWLNLGDFPRFHHDSEGELRGGHGAQGLRLPRRAQRPDGSRASQQPAT